MLTGIEHRLLAAKERLASSSLHGPDERCLGFIKICRRNLGPSVVDVTSSRPDPTTGLSAAGHNFKAKGGGGCAEKQALDNPNALRRQHGYRPDLEPHQVDFTNARAVRDLKGPPAPEKPICNRWCQDLTRPEQYPVWVAYQSPGPWDHLLRRGGSR